MRKLNLTPNFWDVVSITMMCLGVIMLLQMLAGHGDENYVYYVASVFSSATVCMPTKEERERAQA